MLLHYYSPPPPHPHLQYVFDSLMPNPSAEPVFNKHTYKQFSVAKSKHRAHFLLNLSMQLVLTHINFSVSYLILALCLKAVIFGNV